MTLWLAIDTATEIGSAALGEPGTVLTELTFGARRHAAALTPAIVEMLRLADRDFADLHGVVLADGPGSFTGLRIGFATARGMAMSGDFEWRVTPSLMGAAWRARAFGNGPVSAWYDALRGDVFAAVYAFRGSGVETLLVPTRAAPEAIVRTAPVRPVIVVGDGALNHPEIVRGWSGRDPVGFPDGGPRAGALIELLAVPGGTVRIEDPDQFDPHYGRDAEAQVRWEEAHGRPLADS